MPVIMFGGQKGGSGKSTLSTNLCVALAHKNLDVILVDTDPQATSTNWVSRRNELIDSRKDIPLIHSVQKTGNVHKSILDLEKRYQYVVVDAGGNDNEAQRTSMTAADLLYIPLKASQADLETLPYVCSLVDMVKSFNHSVAVFSVISMAPTNPSINEAEEARQFMGDFLDKLSIAKTFIRERKVYRDALLEGYGVLEMENLKAQEELNNFVKETLSNVKVQN